MAKYRVDIADRKIIECYPISGGSNDANLVRQYGSFVHIKPDNFQIAAYLCKASSPNEARIKASIFLNELEDCCSK
jgi:hypothetical protein